MAEPEQPQQPEQGDAQPSPPRVYVNYASLSGGPFDLTATFGYREGDMVPVVGAPLVMTWELVPVLIKLLQQQLDSYEEQVGPVPDLRKRDTSELEDAP